MIANTINVVTPLYQWQPILRIEHIPERIRDFITTDDTFVVLEFFFRASGRVTAEDILKQSKNSDTRSDLATIQFVAKMLCLRGFLTPHEQLLNDTVIVQYEKTDSFLQLK